MKRTLFSAALATGLALTFTGCSTPTDAPKKAAVKKEAPKPVTGQSAIFQMYTVARTWSGDVQLLKVEPINVDGVAPEKGAYGAWRATLVSLAKRQKRDYSYAVADFSQTVIQGARAGTETSYAANISQRPFAIQDVKIDTPKALDAAMTDKDIRAYMEKNPDTPVIYQLEWTQQTTKPAWRVILGPSLSNSVMSAYIDAGDGKFIKKLR